MNTSPRYLSLLALILSGLLGSSAVAQQPRGPDPAVVEGMKKLEFLVGSWKGTGTYQMGPSQKHTVNQTETVQSRNGGTVLLVEGLGKVGEGERAAVVHQALATFTYDPSAKVYRIRAHNSMGQYIDADGAFDGDKFVWGFKEPRSGMQLRFTIHKNEKGQWHEIGEMSQDGKSWRQHLEMTLDKQSS